MEERAPTNKNEQKPILQGCHYVAIELRYSGMEYEKIAIELQERFKKKITAGRIRAWFMRGGILHEAYYAYAKLESERRRREVQEQLKGMLPIIPETLKKVLKERFIITKDGDYKRDEDGDKLPQLDMVTVAAIKQLSDLLGLTVDSGPEGDPVDRFFDRVEEETPEQHAEPSPDPKPVDPPVASS